jgi:trimeric autotransporter adhesin
VVRVLDGEVSDTALLGNRVILSGTFTKVKDTDGVTYDRKYIVAYDQTTGRLDLGFDPVFDRPVNDVSPAPDGSALFVAGEFALVDGVAKKKIVKLTPTGEVVAAFKANSDARVGDIVATPTKVYVGGRFKTINGVSRLRLAAIDPTTGAVDPAFDFPLTQGAGLSGQAYTLALDTTADYSTLMVLHTAKLVGPEERLGVALFNISGPTPTLRPWRTRLYNEVYDQFGYIWPTNGAISPDGSYVVTVHSGGDRPPAFDTAIKFPTAVDADNVTPTWVTRLFDSLYAVAITDSAVYVGGHLAFGEAPGSAEPWPGDTNTNYSYGVDERGPAQLGNQVVRRGHIAALNVTTGKVLAWDPGSDAYKGVLSLTAIPNGLLLGHDGNRVGGFSSIGRHGFFDFRKVPPPEDPDSTIDEPFNGKLIPGGEGFDVFGVAKASRGLKRLQIEVTNKQGLYLQTNGTFAATAVSRTATLASPGATSSNWTLTLPALPANSYTVWSRAIDATNVKEPTKTAANVTVRPVDTTPPGYESLTPACSSTSTVNELTINGVVTDNQAVASVAVSFYESATQTYVQSDGSKGPNFFEFSMALNAPETTRTTITLPITLSNGRYYTTFTARDLSGSIGRNYCSYVVAAGDVPPALAVNVPVEAETITTPTMTFSGTATDDTGVDYVSVYMYRPYDDKGLTADGQFGTPGYVQTTSTPDNGKSVSWTYSTSILKPGTYYATVITYDLAGSSDYEFRTFQYRPLGDPPPANVIQTPAPNTQSFPSTSFTVSGTATDNAGVTGVKVRVRQVKPPYLHLQPNGTWATPVALVDATMTAPGATTTGWSIPLTVPTASDYYVWAFPVDTVGQFPPYDGASYAIYKVYPNDADPVTVVDSPAAAAPIAGRAAVLTGSATDDLGVVAVRTYLYNTATGEGIRLDGTYGSSPVWVPLTLGSPGATATTYSYTTTSLPPGTYGMYVSAEDTVGKWDVRYLFRTFTVPA